MVTVPQCFVCWKNISVSFLNSSFSGYNISSFFSFRTLNTSLHFFFLIRTVSFKHSISQIPSQASFSFSVFVWCLCMVLSFVWCFYTSTDQPHFTHSPLQHLAIDILFTVQAFEIEMTECLSFAVRFILLNVSSSSIPFTTDRAFLVHELSSTTSLMNLPQFLYPSPHHMLTSTQVDPLSWPLWTASQ